jgi:hypothetical protein
VIACPAPAVGFWTSPRSGVRGNAG